MPIKPHKSDRWPPKVKIRIYDEDFELIDESKDTKYDLNDNLMQAWPKRNRTVYIGIKTLSVNWPNWDEESIKCIEELIKFDLNFDGNSVVIKRVTKETGKSCSEEFIWKLRIHADF